MFMCQFISHNLPPGLQYSAQNFSYILHLKGNWSGIGHALPYVAVCLQRGPWFLRKICILLIPLMTPVRQFRYQSVVYFLQCICKCWDKDTFALCSKFWKQDWNDSIWLMCNWTLQIASKSIYETCFIIKVLILRRDSSLLYNISSAGNNLVLAGLHNLASISIKQWYC